MKVLTCSQNFQWVGEGIPIQKHRRAKKIRYEAFILGNLKIEIGDFVLVRNDDALDPEDFMNCYVAQVKNLFDTEDELDPYQAQVQWFSRVLELPSYAIRLFKNAGHELEVVKDKRSSWHDMIDAETIFQKCEVLFLPSDCDFESALSEYKNHSESAIPVFFCRYVFTGTSLTEVKDKFINNSSKNSLYKENTSGNGFISNTEKTVANDIANIKSKSPEKTQERYCAISVGSPTKIPRVVIKRIDDKILESRNRNVRIFVADSNVENIEDVAKIFLNKLKFENEEENSSEEKPAVNSQNCNLERSSADIELMDIASSVESETSNTSQKISNKYSIKFNPKFCKNGFSYNTRNSPKKNGSVKTLNICTTPTKKPKITMLNELRLKPPTQKMQHSIDENIPRPGLIKNEYKTPEKQYNTDASENKFKNDDKKEKDAHLFNNDVESDPLSRSFRTRKSLSKVIDDPVHKSSKKITNIKKASLSKSIKMENPDPYSTPKKKYLKTPVQKMELLTDENIPKPILVKDKRKTPEKQDVRNCSLNKYAKTENSDPYSTPKKRAKVTDVLEEFRLTRSGRRVKAVNYTEEKNETSLISSAIPTKDLPRYIHNNYSDDSDSDNFSASSVDSDNDESLSGVSLLDETSPNKAKNSSKKKTATKKSRNNLNMRIPKTRKNLIDLSIPERKTPLRAPKNALEESRQRLHVSSVPSSLPCRDEEYSDIYSFVKGCLCAQTGGCMYISGVPGTGKTATVHEVMRNLEEERELGEVPIFTFVEVNGMWMTDPYQCYVQIFKALTGKSIAPQQAADLLEKRFTERGPKKDAVVLLVDELDRLWTRKQTVMYNIFDWPTKNNSKLVVLAIANTMDLPERMMMNRISSRLGLTRKTFQPYTFKQLQEIIMSRIQELKVFDPDAVQLVARKVAAVSGDARRALDICRFATETIKIGQTKKSQKILVGMEHVDKALQQMFSSPVISAIRSSSKIVKLFFQCLLSEFTRSGLEETTLLKVHQQVISACRFEGLNPPNSTEISRICADLAASHLILVDNFKNDLYMKIRLNISSDDVTYALTLK